MTKNTEEQLTVIKKSWNVTDKRFVCFLDIMGFKDMVMRNFHENIYKMLEKLSKDRATLEATKLPSGYEPDSIKTVSFSDSIVIFTKNDSKECFELLTYAASWLFGKAMQTGIPLKGAISHGDMSVNISRQIFFGQPLIDAYLLEEDLSFYGIVVHNTVENFINQNPKYLVGKVKYIDCLIPFKSRKINHYILNWISAILGETEIEKKNNALDLMRMQREQTSGSPRKYIDNTIDVINQTYKQINANEV